MAEKEKSSLTTAKVQLAVIANDQQYIKDEVREIKALIQSAYVTKNEFSPVRNIAFGLVGLILAAVGAATISLVVGV